MSVENMLVLSTANLDPTTADNLADGVHFGISEVFTRETGYLLFPAAILASVNEGNDVPKCIRDAADLAILDHCEILMFDCDGNVDGRIPEYFW